MRTERELPEACTRPALPPTVWAAGAFWCGCIWSEALAWAGMGSIGSWCALAVFGVCSFAACARLGSHSVLRALRVPSWVTLVVCALSFGLVLGGLFWGRVEHDTSALRALSRGASVEAVADGSAGRFAATARVRIRSGVASGATASVVLPSGADVLLSGERAWVRGALDGSETRDEWARRRHRAGESGRVRLWSATPLRGPASLLGAVSPVRRNLLSALEKIPGEQGALLQGVLLGERNRVRGTSVEADFRTTGLSHVLAVSGTHLVIVAYMLGALLSRTPLPSGVRTGLIVGFTGVYVLLTGSPASSIRALLMGCVAGLAGVSGRRNDALSALAAAVWVILIQSPAQAFDIGFALSVAAVAGLVVFSPLADRWAMAASPRALVPAARALSTPMVAQAATAPVAIPVFGMVSLIGPLANIVVLPPSSVSLGIGIVGALVYLAAPVLGMPLLRLAALPMWFIARVTAWLADVPYAAIPLGGSALAWGVGAAFAFALLWICWPHPTSVRAARWAAVACGLAGVALASGMWAVPSSAQIAVLDVGQGDAVLIRDGAHAVLVDTGPDAATMRQAAARTGLRRLDAVLLTHPHADHTGGITGLEGVVGVARVLVPAGTLDSFDSCADEVESVSGAAAEPLSQGDRLRSGAWSIEVLWPPPDVDESLGCNDASLILRVSHPGGFSAILTGDAESAPQAELLDSGQGRGPCDMLKVPHHGSTDGVDPGTLSEWSPRLAVISVGRDNDFGHPAESTLAQLERAGAAVLRTDHSGDIRVRVTRGGFRVERQRPGVEVRDSAQSHGIIESWAQVRGTVRSACATIASAVLPASRMSAIDSMGQYDSHGSDGSQGRLPHLRPRGPPAGAGDRAAQEALLRRR